MPDAPTLTQVQIIQSLSEALAWMEKEISWGVSPSDLNHLTGRIGELYAAMITRGQMALATNQRGYDVVSASNERISVKTVTTSTSVTFKKSTFGQADRVMVLRINNDPDAGLSVEEVLDSAAAEAEKLMTPTDSTLIYSLSRNARQSQPIEKLRIVDRATYKGWEIRKYESGAIRVAQDGVLQQITVKDVLRSIAPELGVEVTNSVGGGKNTQQLGADIIRAIKAASARASSLPSEG